MITAEEARELAGPTLEERVEQELERVYKEIKAAAEKKMRSLNLTTEFWTYGGYNYTDAYKECYRQLEKLGYKVKFVYEERQFVNMYTRVEW